MHLAPPRFRRHATGLLAGVALLLTGAGTSLAGTAETSSASSAEHSTNTPSSAHQKALARHLKEQGALVYGAWWCPHCSHQKELFGSTAVELLPYVECDKDDAGRQRCQAAQVRVYPTWVLKGERREGVLSLEELQIWSRYTPSGVTPPR